MQETTVREMAAALNLQILAGADWLEKPVGTAEIHRPALELAGFFPHYPADRVQIIGRTEHDFFKSLAAHVQQERAEMLLHENTPCLIYARGLAPSPAIADCAGVSRIPLLGSHLPTTRLISRLGHWLDNVLAPRQTLHGVFVELLGVGVLLTGASGIGKSEVALELIKKGHRLVADDAVEVRRPAEDILVGACPAVLANLLEIRGLGIIDVCKVFGPGAVRPEKRVDMVVHFEEWREGGTYDRLGFETNFQDLLGVKVPTLTIPVAPGRNLAILVETAAVNYRAKTLGVDVAAELSRRIAEEMKKNSPKCR